ncbi:MAG TPA: hypothetical protein VE133_08010 [Candidatus Sulfotelmatobacter sp.]|nr:hypothetical protein [Candidatus Sulfotelmatobacter sp.]
MSLRKKVLVVVLGSALALIMGRNLKTIDLDVVSAMASAVWGS